MRRLLHYLRFAPAGLSAVLAAAWVISWFGSFGYFPNICGPNDRCVTAWCRGSKIGCGRHYVFGFPQDRYWYPAGKWRQETFAGHWTAGKGDGNWQVEVPIPAILTALMPLTLGAITGFRNRLWQYLAYTALISCELAYYCS